jgi:multisubunit Na+/H+ antiporter MnhG subunit
VSVRDGAVLVLLFAGIAVQALGCLGVAVMRTPFDRLHFTGFSVLAAVALAAAITVREGFSLIADKALLVAAVVVVTSPVIVQVVGHAVRIADRGGLDPHGDDVGPAR